VLAPALTEDQEFLRRFENEARTLASLADLRDRGAITPEEYEQKKADLLSRL
jgi:hypothetical protein